MEKIRKMLPYLLVILLAFYLLPLTIKDTGSAMLILLYLFPTICLIISFIYGIKNSFNWLFSLIVMLMSIPAIFIFYNESASIYIVPYGVISLIGNFLGSVVYKKMQ